MHKTNILPRQARDKHRENSKKDLFPQGMSFDFRLKLFIIFAVGNYITTIGNRRRFISHALSSIKEK